MNKIYILLLIIIFYPKTIIKAEVIIQGHIKGSNSEELLFYSPIDNFANLQISNSVRIQKEGKFSIHVEIETPYFVTLRFNQIYPILLLIEPNDSIFLEIDLTKINALGNTPKNREDWLKVYGSNAIGHLYFNDYNFIPIDKFYRTRAILDKKNTTADVIYNALQKQINKETNWLDSLFNLGLITRNYVFYTKADLNAVLKADIIQQYKNSLGTINSRKYILQQVKDKILNNFSQDSVGLGHGHYFFSFVEFYYENLAQKNQTLYDTNKVIVPEVAYFTLAPARWQKYQWGFALISGLIYSPDMYDYEYLFQKFKSQYPDSEWIPHLEKVLELRRKPKDVAKDNSIYFVDSLQKSQNLQYLFQNELKGKRLYVDFWATWCAPCKAELRHYNDIHAELEKLGVQSLFISIDDLKDKEKWKKVVNATNLSGYHTLASEKLQDDILEKIFEMKNISVPMYLLVDEQGNIIVKDAPRPSSGNILITEIKKAFNIKE